LENIKELHPQFYHVWKMFIELDSVRTNNGFGYNPISYTEIHAYCVLNQIDLDDWELELIRRFDKVVLNIYSERQELEQQKRQKAKA
jgi:hypothetical protein